MATKSITITEEAYERLASFKKGKESFSDVINKITKKHTLLELVGILSDKEANELKKAVSDIRKDIDHRFGETAKKLK